MALAELAINNRAEIAESLLDTIEKLIDPRTVIKTTGPYQGVMARLVERRPDYLDSEGLSELGQPLLTRLVSHIADAKLADKVIARLIHGDSSQAAPLLAARFPEVVERRVFVTMTTALSGQGGQPSSTWMAICQVGSRIDCGRRLLGYAKTTTGIAAVALFLDHSLDDGQSIGTERWGRAVISCHDDVRGQVRQRMLSYLLALGISEPSKACEPLFEIAFEETHLGVVHTQLPEDAINILESRLPSLHWWQQWDIGLRLRIATVTAYITARMSPESFRRLTTHPDLYASLVALAGETKEGRRFLRSQA